MKGIQLLIVATAFLISSIVDADDGVYQLTLNGRKCVESRNQQSDCTYTIGKDLKFSIDGIGMPDTGITFFQSNFEGDYYATFGLMHGCVIVKRGMKTLKREVKGDPLAFVSPKNGKVYRTWEECKAGF